MRSPRALHPHSHARQLCTTAMRSVTRGDNIHGTRNPAAHQHPLPTAHTSRRRSSYMSSYCPLQLVHTRSTRAAWRLSPANATFQAPGGIYTARPTPMQRIVTCAAAGRCVRTRRVCVQQAAVALTSRQQRRCTLSRTLLVRLSDEGYPSLEGARSVHCMARCRRPTSLALSSSSCLGTRCRVPTVPCVRILSDYCDHHAV